MPPMHTQNRRRMRTSIGLRLLCTVGIGILMLVPEALQAQSTGPVGSLVSNTKQEADRLVAITRPGYYKVLLVPDWRVKQGDRTQAVTAAAGLCSRARAQTEVSPILQLSGTRLDEKQVQLTWETSNDGTSYTIAIERSLQATDGFETVSFLQPISVSSQGVTRQMVDPNAYAGYSYYRLKRFEQSGATTYSQTVAVKGELAPLMMNVFPNPGQQRSIRFQVAGPVGPASVSVSLYDVQGRMLYQHDQVSLDADRRFSLPAATVFQPGNYYLKISTNDQHTSTSFILQP